jgi:exonuclease III
MMAARVHRPPKVFAFNANGIGRQRYELSKQLQEQRIDVALLSETHLKPHERFFIPNYHFYQTDRFPGRKGGTTVAVRKGIPHDYVDLPSLVSIEAAGVCLPIGNSELMLAAVYKSPGRAWSDADVIELLSFRHKSVLAGDLNAKHLFWNSAVSNPSGEKLLKLFDSSEFEITAPQCPTHYSPAGNGDVLDIVVHQNARLSEVIVSDVLDSDHLPILFHILDHVTTRNLSDPIEKFRLCGSWHVRPAWRSG